MFYKYFFDDAFLHLIKEETNRYARQKITPNAKRYSIASMWKPCTIQELKAFFAIIVHMGLVKKPEIYDYWSTDTMLDSNFARHLLSRNRFTSILSMLHIADNCNYIPFGNPGHDPLFKIRPFIEILQVKFREGLVPEQNLSLDEATCPFKGRIKFRVYNPHKPKKWGIKIYEVCESSSGYCCEFEVYAGSNEGVSNSAQDLTIRLMRPLLNKGHWLFTDRYYTSPALYVELLKNHTIATGTCMPNRRGLPTEYLKAKLKAGETLACKSDALLALKWKDKRDVVMLSSGHDSSSCQVTVRSRYGRSSKSKPVVINDYNSHMAGVDRSDQLMSYYPFGRKSFKWWKKLFFHLHTLVMTNAYTLHKKALVNKQMKVIPLKKFVQSVGDELCKEVRLQNITNAEPTDRLTGRHFMEKIPPTNHKENVQRKCKVCSKRAAYEKQHGLTVTCKRKESTYQCKTCKVALCVVPCFEIYHTQTDFEVST